MKIGSYKYCRIFYYGLIAGIAIGIFIISYFLICYNTPIAHFSTSLNDEDCLQIHIPEHTRSLSGSLLGYKTIP